MEKAMITVGKSTKDNEDKTASLVYAEPEKSSTPVLKKKKKTKTIDISIVDCYRVCGVFGFVLFLFSFNISGLIYLKV